MKNDKNDKNGKNILNKLKKIPELAKALEYGLQNLKKKLSASYFSYLFIEILLI